MDRRRGNEYINGWGRLGTDANLRMMAEQIDALERDRVMNPPGRATEQAQ